MRFNGTLVSMLLVCCTGGFAARTPPEEEETRPQISRLVYVQGVVKLSPGIGGTPALDQNWVAAGVNFPVEEGVTLATEVGRAQVELESGSVLYVAEHTVVEFLRLAGDDVGTKTEVAVITGRATIALPSGGHALIALDTPTAVFHITAGTTVRVDSALDGTVFLVLNGSLAIFEGSTGRVGAVLPGEAVQSIGGILTRLHGAAGDADQKAWDQWVNDEWAARKADVEKGLKESGLATPIPGLVELVRGGTFSDCAPFGRCWEPKDAPPAEPAAEAGQAMAGSAGQNAARPGVMQDRQPQEAGVQYKQVRVELGSAFSGSGDPCFGGPGIQTDYYTIRTIRITPQNPQGEVVKEQRRTTSHSSGWWPQDWATCYAGSWVPVKPPERARCRRGRPECPPPHKKWVVGPKSKGGSFVQVRIGKKLGFVPRNPRDVKGKLPINAKDGVLMPQKKGGQIVTAVRPAPKTLQVEKRAPGYETLWVKSWPKAERPAIEGRLLNGGVRQVVGRAPQAGAQSTQAAFRYDYRTGSFVALAPGGGSVRGGERPLVIAHAGVMPGSGAPVVNRGLQPGNAADVHGAAGGGTSWHGSAQPSSHTSYGGGAPSHSSYGGGGGGGGSSSHSSYGSGGGGGGSSHSSYSGGGGGGGNSGGGGGGSSGHSGGGSSGGYSGGSSSSSSSGGGGGSVSSPASGGGGHPR